MRTSSADEEYYKMKKERDQEEAENESSRRIFSEAKVGNHVPKF